jgi:putative glutamine amidotransferase
MRKDERVTRAKPLRIGLTTSTDDAGVGGPDRVRILTKTAYPNWVERVGGLPLLLPNLKPELVGPALDGLDGVLLTGGKDVHPLVYGAEPEKHLGTTDPQRDRFEMPLIRETLARGLPLLAICRGLQALNAAVGGTLRQDLVHDRDAAVQHRMDVVGENAVHHTIEIEPGSLLHRLLGAPRVAVNSWHHQAADRLGDGLRVSARARDGTIEALEGLGEQFVLAVQWHPEVMPASDAVTRAIFEGFIAACRARRAS